jgi:saccharopine dehydrogenase-like NADP-dependent oxidoreductase
MYYRDPQEQDAQNIAATERAIRELDAQAKAKGLVILTEFGLDPGLDLILGAAALAELDEVHEFHAYGAGIPGPNARNNPLMYKFSWSPIGVMRSYRRPARIITAGEVVDIDPTALFEPGRHHLLDVEAIGAPLECYPNGDAVHYAELFGIRDTVREMARYTGRLPGHCAFWNVMVKSGFLDSTPLSVGDVRVDVRGTRGNKAEAVRVIYDLVDTRDFATGFTSMQRTVGFTLARGARLILAGEPGRHGLLTPLDVPYASVFPALERHGIHVERRELPWCT